MDPREQILARVLQIAESVAAGLGVQTVERNKDDFSEMALPAFVLLDGDEEGDESDPLTRPTNAPRRVTMKAQLVVLASGAPASIGATVNGYRIGLLVAIVNDATLIGLVLDGQRRQSIRYIGTSLTIASGRAIEAELRMDLEFTYALVFTA